MAQGKDYNKIRAWIELYAHPEVDDRRAVETCVICESDEFMRPLQTQLHQISKGDYDEELMTNIVGNKRKAKHGSFEEWAKMMLLWLHEVNKKA